ncbi:hypothetical protein D3C87_1224500 [compost metagenome]
MFAFSGPNKPLKGFDFLAIAASRSATNAASIPLILEFLKNSEMLGAPGMPSLRAASAARVFDTSRGVPGLMC